jgi:flagella basal body P-ring formation protein FlgA
VKPVRRLPILLALAVGAAFRPAPAPAMPLATIEARLPALVGIDADQGVYVVDWTEPVPREGEITGLRWDARERTVSASLADGSTTGRPITGRVRLLAQVPTPLRPIPPGATLAAADLDAMDVDLLTAHRETVLDAAQALDHAARRRLEPGRPILARDLKLVPAVERSQLVTIVAATGRVSVRGKAKALDSGRIGETVRVQNVDSRKVTSGTVVERGLVDVGGRP